MPVKSIHSEFMVTRLIPVNLQSMNTSRSSFQKQLVQTEFVENGKREESPQTPEIYYRGILMG